MKKSIPCLILLLGALVLVACGGDEGGEADEAAGLPSGDVSREEYIAQADEVCAATNDAIDARAEEYVTELGLGPDEQPTPEQAGEFINEVLVPEVENELQELRALEAPEQDAAELAEIYDLVEQNLQALAEDPDGFDEQEDPFEEPNQRARDYGFEVCGSD